MTSEQPFADPVVVPGPNLRSRFVDTEDVGVEDRELVEGDGVDGLSDEQRRTIASLPRELPPRGRPAG